MVTKYNKYTEKEWREKGTKLFGDNIFEWKFECPACHNIMSPNLFKAYKEKGANPNSAYQECVGRYTGGREGPNKCDWASYGLFRGPDCVVAEDGKEVWVFPFHEVTEGEG